jgi:hypothetical protein
MLSACFIGLAMDSTLDIVILSWTPWALNVAVLASAIGHCVWQRCRIRHTAHAYIVPENEKEIARPFVF